MAELTLAEITRWLEKHDAKHDSFVPRELYNEVVAQIKADVAEIKESSKWLMRLVLTNLAGFLVYLLTNLLTNAQS